MKNIVFDLGGVVFARDPRKCPPELLDFFSFVRDERMPCSGRNTTVARSRSTR